MRRLGLLGLRALARCNPEVAKGDTLGIRAAIRFQDGFAVIKRDGAGSEKHTNGDPPSHGSRNRTLVPIVDNALAGILCGRAPR
jgi:hypothetical protein